MLGFRLSARRAAEKRAGWCGREHAPAAAILLLGLGPALDEFVVVDGFALRLLVLQLGLGTVRTAEPLGMRAMVMSISAARRSIASCGVNAPELTSPICCHQICASFG